MGQTKLLLDLGGIPILARLLDTLQQAGIDTVVVVTRKTESEIARFATERSAVVVQPDVDPPDMRSSVEHALEALREQRAPEPNDGWLLIPADHPVLEADIVKTIIREWLRHEAAILLPTFEGQRGHPTIFRWSLADEVSSIPQTHGLNWLVKSQPDRVLEVPVNSDAVLIDLDTPADYARLIERVAAETNSGKSLMLTPEEFATQWNVGKHETLQKLSPVVARNLAIGEEDRLFLIECGLPVAAAPYLEFTTSASGCETVTDAYEASPKLARYRIIGGTAEGNPIVIDEQQSGEIAVLDHEENFRRTFMNSSARHLAESLLAYRKMVQAATEANGEDAFYFNQIPPAAVETLRSELTRIDPNAVSPGRFWSQELENLAEPIADV